MEKGGGEWRVRTRLEKNARKSAVRQETNRRSFPRGRPSRLVRRTRVPLMTDRRECWFIRFSLPFPLPHNLGVSIFYSLFLYVCFFFLGRRSFFSPTLPLVFVFITDVRRRAARQRSSVIREAGGARGCPCPATTSFISFAYAAIATRHYTCITVTVIMIAFSAAFGQGTGCPENDRPNRFFFRNRCCFVWSEKA